MLRFDPRTQEATLVGQDLGWGIAKWRVATVGPDGCVYRVPYEASQALRFDPRTLLLPLPLVVVVQ